ncbi:MAG: tetratricopeptide repeat protein [Lachnospiraceae bacterium]
MEYKQKLIYQSNYWYNDGLKKANIRDVSGAIASLKRSLQYNRENIAARNLLGLVYFGRGEVAEALVEWIISKNLKSYENIANYYIKKVQETPSELEVVNQAVRKYNQCVSYCEQHGEDLAIIQLKKVVVAHPTLLKAHQLLALLYIQTEQYAKARQELRRAHKLDSTNEITLAYMHELTQLHNKKVAKLKEDKNQTVSYTLGNETIIQPVSASLKDNAGTLTIVNIILGILVGAAIVWFLITPAVNQSRAARLNKEIITYSDQIASQKAEISALKKELEGYRATSEETAEAQQTAASAQASYEALMVVEEHQRSSSYTNETLAKELLEVKKEALGDGGKTRYDALAGDIFPSVMEKKYKAGKKSYEVANYEEAATSLELVISLEATYDDGGALLALAQTYTQLNQADKAKETYQKIVELLPDTEVAATAEAAIAGTPPAEDTKTE